MSRKDNEKKETKPRKTEETSIGREIWEYVKMIAIVVAVVVFVEQVIVINARIPSPSMENTIMTGDQIFGNRLAYVKSDPQRYDIVIFYYPDDEKQKFIKRVIGLPGETVQIMDDGSIYINGEKLEENYGMEVIKPETIGRAAEPIELGDDEYLSWETTATIPATVVRIWWVT